MKNILKNSFVFFGWLAAGLVGGLLVVNILVGLIGSLMGLDNIMNALRGISYTLILCIAFFGMSYGYSYKNGTPELIPTIASGALMSIYQLIIAKILKFVMYTSGGAYYFAQMFYTLRGQEAPAEYETPDIVYIVIMLMLDVIYIALIILGGRIGAAKREQERIELTSKVK